VLKAEREKAQICRGILV